MASQTVASLSAKVMENGPSRKWLCELCKIECNSAETLEHHKMGKRHKKNLKKGRKGTLLYVTSAIKFSTLKRFWIPSFGEKTYF